MHTLSFNLVNDAGDILFDSPSLKEAAEWAAAIPSDKEESMILYCNIGDYDGEEVFRVEPSEDGDNDILSAFLAAVLA